MNDRPRWPHQTRAVRELFEAIDRGFRRIIITSPTGGGKWQIIEDILAVVLGNLDQAIVYLNRKLLIDQTSKDLIESNIEYGIRASGHQDEWEQPLQIASIQTQHRRESSTPIHRAKIAIFDEAHLMAGKTARKIMKQHLEQGCIIVMVTATPLDMQDLADYLIQAGTNSELRACGAIVPFVHYGPSEPDFRKLRKLKATEELKEHEVSKLIMTRNIFGKVYESWIKHNPYQKPTILFAPGVSESMGFAKDLWHRGVSVAHMDGEMVWCNGKAEKTSTELRKKVFDWMQAGKVQILCSCFVLREGVNLRFIECLILATIINSLKSYIQIGGRGGRACPEVGKKFCTVIDHGGHWWRLGSLNEDRKWYLNWTTAAAKGLREEIIRSKRCKMCTTKLGESPKCNNCGHINEIEPYRCPKCDRIMNSRVCIPCGYTIPIGRRSRMVLQEDGTMVEHYGDMFRPIEKRVADGKDAEAKWENCFWRALKSATKMTFNQAMALFAKDHDFQLWPNRQFKYMPRNEIDFFRRVCDVPRDRLR